MCICCICPHLYSLLYPGWKILGKDREGHIRELKDNLLNFQSHKSIKGTNLLTEIKKLIPKVVTYRGTSMYPLFRESDILRIYKSLDYIPVKGDIILFEHPDNINPVVHRIYKIKGDRIYTKGDNTPKPDPWVLKKSDIKGRVIQIWRNKRTIQVMGENNYLQGPSALYQQLLNLAWPLYMYLRPAYKSTVLKGIFYSLLPGALKPRPVIFTADNTIKLRLLINKTYVARYDRSEKKWVIKPPFRFLISQECMDKARLDFEKYLLTRKESRQIPTN